LNNPDKDLLNLLKDNWALTDKGLKKTDVRFTQVGYRGGGTDVEELKGLFGVPNIWVERTPTGLVRQAENEEYFSYQAFVHVIYWCKTKDPSNVQADKDKHWKMIEHVKKWVHDGTKRPSNWNYSKVDGSGNRNVEPPIPPILHEVMTINIRLFWEPS